MQGCTPFTPWLLFWPLWEQSGGHLFVSSNKQQTGLTSIYKQKEAAVTVLPPVWRKCGSGSLSLLTESSREVSIDSLPLPAKLEEAQWGKWKEELQVGFCP